MALQKVTRQGHVLQVTSYFSQIFTQLEYLFAVEVTRYNYEFDKILPSKFQVLRTKLSPKSVNSAST